MTLTRGNLMSALTLPGPLDQAVRAVLSRYRAGSKRTVNWAPESGIGLGNMLYFWLWAHQGREYGLDRWVRATPAMGPWLDVFPRTRELVLDPGQLRLRDQRSCEWAQEFDLLARESLGTFIETRLLKDSALSTTATGVPGLITLNVRRGDYYSVPRLRELYGFDIENYVRRALEGAQDQEPIHAVEVVSDDPVWCRDNLTCLAEFGSVRFQGSTDGPLENLAQLASARRLVLANSTFSYWGAYISNVVHKDNHHLVWAPDFHRRDLCSGRAFQLDPRWSVVSDVDTGAS